jgi:hypothetical protein
MRETLESLLIIVGQGVIDDPILLMSMYLKELSPITPASMYFS